MSLGPQLMTSIFGGYKRKQSRLFKEEADRRESRNLLRGSAVGSRLLLLCMAMTGCFEARDAMRHMSRPIACLLVCGG